MKELESTTVSLAKIDGADVMRVVRSCCAVVGRRGMSRSLAKLEMITDDITVYGVAAELTESQFERAKTVYGQCAIHHRTCQIYVSASMTDLQITNTLAHELAHWLVGNQHGHNSRWRRIYAMCLMIACLELQVVMNQGRVFEHCVRTYCRPTASHDRAYALSFDRFDTEFVRRYLRDMINAADRAYHRWTQHH